MAGAAATLKSKNGVVSGPGKWKSILGDSCVKKNKLYKPMDMPGTTTSYAGSPALCQAKCAGTINCKHFGWFPSGECHLQDTSAVLEDVDGVISGDSTCPATSTSKATTTSKTTTTTTLTSTAK